MYPFILGLVALFPSLLAGAGGGEEAEWRIENNSRQRDGRIHHPDAPVTEHNKTKYYTNTFLSFP